MGRYLSIFMLLVIGFSSCKEKPENVVVDVNKKCATINKKLEEYRAKTIDDFISQAPGTITGYYREDELKKMSAAHFPHTKRTFAEYFFDDGMLIYILQQEFIYNLPDTCTEEKARAKNDTAWYDDKKSQLETSRFYFNKNKLVKWIKPDGKEVLPTTAEFIDKEPVLWAEAIILIKQLKETQN